MKQKLFVCLSHPLTSDQIEDLEKKFGITPENIIICSKDLQSEASNVPATATAEEVKSLAAKIILEALQAEATHFMCQGEPCLQLWTNNLANCIIFSSLSKMASYKIIKQICEKFAEMGRDPSMHMKCIQSTTERQIVSEVAKETGEVVKKTVFKHVQWRELF